MHAGWPWAEVKPGIQDAAALTHRPQIQLLPSLCCVSEVGVLLSALIPRWVLYTLSQIPYLFALERK